MRLPLYWCCQFVKSIRTKLELLENITEAKVFMAREKTECLNSEGLDKETLKESELKLKRLKNTRTVTVGA